MAEIGQQEPGVEAPHADDQDWFHSHRSIDPLISPEPIPQGRGGRNRQSGAVVFLVGLALILVIAAVVITKFPPHFSSSSSSTNGDLQQGISNATGLRGHLVTRWEGGKTRYMLKIEPIDPRENEAFAYVIDHQPEPMAITVRVLDSTGFSLCGKQILIPYSVPRAAVVNVAAPGKRADAARIVAARQAALANLSAQELSREKGGEVFKLISGEDGKIGALWSEGTLPCSPDQFQRFDYWNFDTNFPTLAAQQEMMNHDKLVKKAEEDAARASKRPVYKKGPPGFYIEGDDRARNFEPSTGVLFGGAGHSFTIAKKTDQPTIAQWVADDSLIHYTCDQHAVCVLRHAGSSAVIVARMNE